MIIVFLPMGTTQLCEWPCHLTQIKVLVGVLYVLLFLLFPGTAFL
jgi:hypothetical protein